MKDLESQFQTQSTMIRVTPHDRNWERIEEKLQAHRSHRKLFSARLLNIAAAVTLLIVISISAYLYTESKYLLNARVYAMSIEELQTPASTDESMFDVERIRISYADLKK